MRLFFSICIRVCLHIHRSTRQALTHTNSFSVKRNPPTQTHTHTHTHTGARPSTAIGVRVESEFKTTLQSSPLDVKPGDLSVPKKSRKYANVRSSGYGVVTPTPSVPAKVESYKHRSASNQIRTNDFRGKHTHGGRDSVSSNNENENPSMSEDSTGLINDLIDKAASMDRTPAVCCVLCVRVLFVVCCVLCVCVRVCVCVSVFHSCMCVQSVACLYICTCFLCVFYHCRRVHGRVVLRMYVAVTHVCICYTCLCLLHMYESALLQPIHTHFSVMHMHTNFIYIHAYMYCTCVHKYMYSRAYPRVHIVVVACRRPSSRIMAPALWRQTPPWEMTTRNSRCCEHLHTNTYTTHTHAHTHTHTHTRTHTHTHAPGTKITPTLHTPRGHAHVKY